MVGTGVMVLLFYMPFYMVEKFHNILKHVKRQVCETSAVSI